MTKEAKVFIVDDDPLWQKRIADRLSKAKHRVALVAGTRSGAIESTKRLRELGVNVATVDGDLETVSAVDLDGEAVIAAIRANAPEVKIIGVSTRDVAGVDASVRKDNLDQFNKLGKIVNKL